jgi:uncharacterized protein (DUF58 family)
MKRLPMSRTMRWSAGLYALSLSYLLFQGGKTSLMLFVMLNGLGFYLLLGRWSGIGNVQGSRALEGRTGPLGPITAGMRLRIRLNIQVPGFWPIPYVIIREKLVRLQGGETQEYETSCVPDYRRRGSATYETAPLRRGRYRFGHTECSTRDVFGLFEHSGSFRQPLEFLVLPETVELKEWRWLRRTRQGMNRETVTSNWDRETTQIDGVREYRYGDRLSRIHWNATARTGEWKSKEYERESLPRLVVVLDRRSESYAGGTEGFELAVSAAASILDYAMRRGRPVGLVSVGESDAVWFGTGRAAVSRQVLMSHLVDVVPDGKGSFGRLLCEAAERYEPGVQMAIVGPAADADLVSALGLLENGRLNPFHLHIRDRRMSDEDRAKLRGWEELCRSKGWGFCSIEQLHELPRALEVGSA